MATIRTGLHRVRRLPGIPSQRIPILCRKPSHPPRLVPSIRRGYAADGPTFVEAPDHLDEGERKIFDIVKEGLRPTKLEVQDVSGGCGSMYALDIVSHQFTGLPVIKQHRLVNQILGEEIKKWHGVQLKTKAPADGR